jgi:serine/threonine protein kinase
MTSLRKSCLKFFSNLNEPEKDFDEVAFAEFLVAQPFSDTKIQIFHIQNDLAESQKILKMLQIQKNLSHANIASIKDSLATPNLLILEVETLEFTLKNVLNSKKKDLTLNHTKFMFYQMALAVAYLHSQGVEHLNLHPRAFLISNDCEVKLSDFGSANLQNMPKHDELKSSHQNYYISPEIILNNGNNSHCPFKADIWALGCMFFELLEGQSLFYYSRFYLDQLKWMFRFLGAPLRNELDWIVNNSARAWVANMSFSQKKASSYLGQKTKCPFARDLLDKMLNIDPRKRVSINDLLRHPFFQDLFDEEDLDFGKRRFNVKQFTHCHPEYKDLTGVKKSLISQTLN